MKNFLVALAIFMAVSAAAFAREVAWHLAAVLCCVAFAMKILNTTGEDAAWENVKGEMERLRGENAQLRTGEESHATEISRIKEEQHLLRLKDMSAYRCTVQTFHETAKRYKEEERRLINDASKWHRRFEQLRANPPGEETFDVRLNELTTANRALTDENLGMKHTIRRLESQLEAALLPKDSTSAATANSTIADRDQLKEHEYAQLQAVSQENDRLRQEVQNLRTANQTLDQRNSAMYEEGTALLNDNQALRVQQQELVSQLETLSQQSQENQSLEARCQDLSSQLATLSQQSASSQQVSAAFQIEHDALKREVARLHAMEAEHEGETTERRKASEAEMEDLRRQASAWTRTKLEEQEKALRAEFGAQTTLTPQARGPVGAQTTMDAELAQEVKTLREEKETLKQQLTSAEFAVKTQADVAKMAHDGQVRAEGDAQDTVKRYWKLDEEHKQLNDEHKKLQGMHSELSKVYLSLKRERDRAA